MPTPWRPWARAAAVVALAACLAAACTAQPAPRDSSAPSSEASPATGAVTPPPSPGAFSCPAQDLAGSPPSSRLTSAAVEPMDGFDRVTFTFAPSPADHPTGGAGIIVKAVGVPPRTDANRDPLTIAGSTFLEVRFRDMARQDDAGGPAYTGATNLRPASGAVLEVVRIRDDDQVIDWLIGMDSPCTRTWFEGSTALHIDVQRP